MFFILLGFSFCEVTRLCLKSDTNNKCPDGIAADSIVDSAATLQAKIVKDGTFIVFTDLAFELTQEQLISTVEISTIKNNVEVSAKISTDGSHPGITLTGITLSVTKATSAKLLDDAPADLKITFEKAILSNGGAFKTDSLALIKSLQCAALSDAKNVLTYMTKTGSSIMIEGEDVVEKVTGAGSGIKFTKGSTDLDIAENGPSVKIISYITTSTDFTLVSDFTQLSINVDISLIYGNKGEAVITLKEDNFQKSDKLVIKVETYYTKDDSFTNASDITLDEKFLVPKDGSRKVPITPTYCLYKTNKRDNTCPEDATLLWGDKELVGTKNGDNFVTVYLSGYDDAALTLKLKDIADRQMAFTGSVPGKQQMISLILENKDESVTGNLQFNSISVTATVPKDSSDSSLNFKNLLVTNSKIAAAETTDPPPSGGGDGSGSGGGGVSPGGDSAPDPIDGGSGTGSSKKLRATVDIKVNSEDLTSDAASFTAFKAQKPSKSFSVANPKSLDFSGDGSKVTIDTVDFTKDSIPVPFNIVTLPGQDLKDVTLKIEENSGSPGKALPFAFDVKEGSNLSVKYSGDWSSNTIVVNVAAGSSFAGNKASDKDKSPVMEKQGSGTATLDDKVLVSVTEAASPKGGLGGGPIAGIVIACVVVVAAVVVAVFFVVKKKAKVAN